MEYCTGNFFISEEVKALEWMDRFIKRYKYEKETVQTKGNMIQWADGIYRHSICVKDGKFIIDGSEIYINSKLWAKYVKMREITGSWYVRAPKKIAFPNDWSDLSEEQVLENIQYLQKNYKKYDISKPDDKHIKIDNIIICRDNEGDIGNGRTYFIINGKKYYRDEIIGKEIIDLMHLCKMHIVPFKEKATKWFKQNRNIIIGSGIFIICSHIAYFTGKETIKGANTQKTIKEISDSSLQEEQQKIINYNDSIKQNVK